MFSLMNGITKMSSFVGYTAWNKTYLSVRLRTLRLSLRLSIQQQVVTAKYTILLIGYTDLE